MLPGRGGRVAAIAALLACACTPSTTPAQGQAAPAAVTYTVGAQELQIDFDFCNAGGESPDPTRPCGVDGAVDLRVVSCSASLACDDAFLHDPLTAERAPTLITGFSCGFDDGQPDQDALLAYHPDLRCYTAGRPADRTTWQPPGGIAITPAEGEHLFFSRASDQEGDVYTNSAWLMRPLRTASGDGHGGYGFCELEAWGAIAFADRADGVRHAEHDPWAPAVVWRGIVQWSDTGGWDCHMDDPALTSVKTVVLASATHDEPTPAPRTELPAWHNVMLLREEPLDDAVDFDPDAVETAVALRFATASEFPLPPNAAPAPMTRRSLWIDMPDQRDDPADLRIEKTCAEIDADHVTAIGALVSDRLSHVELGAIIVWPAIDGRPWDCERGDDGSCRRYEQSEYADLVPCLLPLTGDPPQ